MQNTYRRIIPRTLAETLKTLKTSRQLLISFTGRKKKSVAAVPENTPPHGLGLKIQRQRIVLCKLRQTG